MMEMPTPCEGCGEVVEFDDMNPCGTCKTLYCQDCLSEPHGDCDNCKELEGETHEQSNQTS